MAAQIPVSVYTPTDGSDHIKECYESLKNQTYSLWEWILVPNGGVEIPEEISSDDRVLIAPFESDSIGELKDFAIRQCSGELFVELDHDDMLVPTALETLAEQQADSGAGFLYSDFVTFQEDHTPVTYGEEFGWEHYPFEFADKKYTAMRAFDPTPDSLFHLQFSPNHVRAWTRDAYDHAGGYDGSFSVGDDYDLITRTYLTGADFLHIPECLYMYRSWDGSRSLNEKNAEIQKIQRNISNKRTYPIVDVWARKHNLDIINVTDPWSDPSEDRENGVQDVPLNGIHSLPDNSAGRIIASEVLQFLPRDEMTRWMNSAYRVLAPNGWLTTQTPSTDGRAAFEHPGYQSYWNQNTFWCFTHKSVASQMERYDMPGVSCRFYAARVWSQFPSPNHEATDSRHVYADLVAKKDKRLAGKMQI